MISSSDPAKTIRLILHAVVLLILSNGPVFLVSRRLFDRPGTWEESIVRPSFIGAAAIMVGLAVFTAMSGSLRRPTPALAFAGGFAAVAVWSVTWSLAPQLTGWRSWIYVAMVIGALASASLPLDEWLDAIRLFVSTALIASLAAITLRPDIGLDEFGSWRGIYLSPNSMAPIAAIGVVLALASLVGSRSATVDPSDSNSTTPTVLQRWLALIGLVVSAVLLIGAGSATAIVALIGSVGLSATVVQTQRLIRSDRPTEASRLVGVASALGAIGAAIAGPRLWATANFALRRELWDLLAARIEARPVRGYGFFAFWDVPSVLVPRLLVRTGSAHNSFVEIALGLGVIGLAFFIPVMLYAIAQPMRGAWKNPDQHAFAWLAIAVFVFASNLTESFVLWFSYMWLLLMASAIRRPWLESSR